MQYKKIYPFLAAAITSLLMTACFGGEEILPTSDPKETDVNLNKEIAEPTIDVCTPLHLEVAFPRQKPVTGPREMMAAELFGDLILQDGCLLVDSLDGDGSFLPIWPPEFTLMLEDGISLVLDGDGNIAGRVGEEIYMGGGTGTGQAMLECVKDQIPQGCEGTYWVVGDGVRLNLIFDSDLFTMDLVPALDRTAILLKKMAILDEWAGEPGTITGHLRFYFPDRCPRIRSVSGMRDFLPIWPQGYTLRIENELVEILDRSGEVAAKQDELVTLTGALVPPNWENLNYRSLTYETPGDCIGPYWIVSEK